jgi:hypothetical protein
VRLCGAAALVLLVCFAGVVAGAGSMDAYPRLDVSPTAADTALAMLLPVLAALPFLGRRARLGVRLA